MGRLYQRHAGGNFYADFDTPEGRRVQRSLGTRDRAVAKERLRQAELAATPGARGRRQSLSEALDAVIERQRGSDGTKHMYQVKSRRLVAVLGDVDIGTITIDTLEGYVAQRLSTTGEHGGVKAHTVVKEMIVLRRAFKLANKRGILPIIPPFPDLATGYVPKEVWLDAAELERLLAALPLRRQRWVVLAALGGMRKGEVERLQWPDLARVIRVPGKKTKLARRNVPLAPALLVHLDLVPADDRRGPVVEPWTNVCRDLAAACTKANVKRVSPNDLRRTFASWLVQQGVPLLTVATLLGHSSTRMVERVYGRLSADNLEAAIAAVPAFAAPAGAPYDPDAFRAAAAAGAKQRLVVTNTKGSAGARRQSARMREVYAKARKALPPGDK